MLPKGLLGLALQFPWQARTGFLRDWMLSENLKFIFFWATRKIPFLKSSMSHRCLFCPYVHHGWLRRSERIWLHKWFFHTVARVKRVETRVSNSTMKSEAQGWSSEPLSPTTYIPYIVSQVPTDLQEVCFRICVCTLSNILCFLKR